MVATLLQGPPGIEWLSCSTMSHNAVMYGTVLLQLPDVQPCHDMLLPGISNDNFRWHHLWWPLPGFHGNSNSSFQLRLRAVQDAGGLWHRTRGHPRCEGRELNTDTLSFLCMDLLLL